MRSVFCQQGLPGPVGPLGPAGPSGEKVQVLLLFLKHIKMLILMIEGDDTFQESICPQDALYVVSHIFAWLHPTASFGGQYLPCSPFANIKKWIYGKHRLNEWLFVTSLQGEPGPKGPHGPPGSRGVPVSRPCQCFLLVFRTCHYW